MLEFYNFKITTFDEFKSIVDLITDDKIFADLITKSESDFTLALFFVKFNAIRTGLRTALEEGLYEIGKKMKQDGVPFELIKELTKLGPLDFIARGDFF
jgi:hypothetical protein